MEAPVANIGTPRYKHKGVDLSGQKFGDLLVQYKVRLGYGAYKWVCRCDCGNTTLVTTYHLIHGDIKSCGCKHTSYGHGQTQTRLYAVWCSMKARCQRKTHHKYKRYGGRGIKVCEEWQSFPAFYTWAIQNGYDEQADYGQCTIDRIDNDGDYEPSNCRWVDLKTQANNKHGSRERGEPL